MDIKYLQMLITYTVRFRMYQYGRKSANDGKCVQTFPTLDDAIKFRDKLIDWKKTADTGDNELYKNFVWSYVEDGFLDSVDSTIYRTTEVWESIDV